MRPGPAIAFALLLLVAPSAAVAQEPQGTPAERALAWLAGEEITANLAPYFVEAASAAGLDPKRWPPGGDAFSRLGPYDYGYGPYYSHTRVAYAAASAGYDPTDVGGTDYLALVREGFRGSQSGESTNVNDDAWAILALRAAGVPADDAQVRASVTTLRASQLPDGSWAHAFPALRGATDETGMALAALRAAGEDMSDFARAKSYLDSTYDAATHGHRPYLNGASSPGPSTQSTVWALHGYAALGVAPRPETLARLSELQRTDGGFSTWSTGPSQLWPTLEATVVLAGERHALPSYAPLVPPAPVAHVGEPLTLPVPSGFTRAVYSFADGDASGGATRTFGTLGMVPYRLVAESDATRARVEGTITVLSARPSVGALPESVSLPRNTTLTLDLAQASDADGHIVAFQVDWGDGHVTGETSHAYARLGSYRLSVRAQDDTGVWSHPAMMRVEVENRAPVLGPLPARLVADRVHPLVLNVTATDADGDALTGVGPRALPHATLGNATHEIVVEDAFGGIARANVTVEVANLPPRVTLTVPARADADEEILLRANATDADGPAPSLAWSTGSDRVRLPAGAHVVRVIATDADGATAEASATIVVEDAARDPAEPSATPTPWPASARGVEAVAPDVRAFDATLAEGALTATWDADGRATLRWTSDVGEGARADATSPVVVQLAGASWARAELLVERDGLVASRETGLLTASAPAPPTPTTAPASATEGAREPVVVASEAPEALPDRSPAGPSERVEDAEVLVPAGVRSEPGSPRETPALPVVGLLAALALAATRRRRAA